MSFIHPDFPDLKETDFWSYDERGFKAIYKASITFKYYYKMIEEYPYISEEDRLKIIDELQNILYYKE